MGVIFFIFFTSKCKKIRFKSLLFRLIFKDKIMKENTTPVKIYIYVVDELLSEITISYFSERNLPLYQSSK